MQSASAPSGATDHSARASPHQLLHNSLQVMCRTTGTLAGFADLKVSHPNSADYNAWRLHSRADRLDPRSLTFPVSHSHARLTLKTCFDAWLPHLSSPPPSAGSPRSPASSLMTSMMPLNHVKLSIPLVLRTQHLLPSLGDVDFARTHLSRHVRSFSTL